MTARRRWAWLVPCLLVLAACTTTPAAAPPPEDPTATDRVEVPPEHVSIPVRVAHGPSGESCVVADVLVGYLPDNHTVPVEVDTASTGLVLTARSIGPSAVPTGTSYRNGLRDLGPFPVNVVKGGMALAGPDGTQLGFDATEFGSLPTDAALKDRVRRCGPVQGVLGIAVGGTGPDRPELDSPLLHLGRPFSDGVSLGLSGDTGTLRVGPPEASPRSIVLPLVRATGTSPNGAPAYRRAVNVCWTVGGDQGCGPTTLGGSAPTTGPELKLPDVPSIPGAEQVLMAAPNGDVLGLLPDGLPRVTRADVSQTGPVVLQDHTVAYDLEGGRVLVTPR